MSLQQAIFWDSIPARSQDSWRYVAYTSRSKASEQVGTSVAETLLNLIIRIIAGIVGGYTAGSAGGKPINLGTVPNSILGGIGGVVGGPVLTGVISMIFGSAHNASIALDEQAVGSSVAGAILTIIIGAIKNKMAA